MIRQMTVVALGEVPKGLLEAAAAKAGQAFSLEHRLGVGLAKPEYAFNENRGQYNSAAILRKLTKIRKEGELVLGVGLFELFEPDAEALVADGDRDARTGVVGAAAFKTTDTARYLERTGHAAIIAVGKARGLRECSDSRCGMAAVNQPTNLDKRSGRLCSSCEIIFSKGDRAWAR